MKMKRIISFLVAFALSISLLQMTNVSFAAQETDFSRLYAFGITENQTDDLERTVTRGEMAYLAVGLYGEAVAESAETVFSDVLKEHKFSGAISFAQMKKIVSSQEFFYPDKTVKYEEAVKMVVAALDYEYLAQKNGGYPTGYINLASQLGLLKGINAKEGDDLTLYSALTLINNALGSEVCNSEMVIVNGETINYVFDKTTADDSVLRKRFSISIYRAFITEMDFSSSLMRTEIISKDKDDTKALYKNGDNAVLTMSEAVKNTDCKYTMADIYVTDNDEVVFAEVRKNIEIKTGIIYEVNKSQNDAPYDPSYINSIAFEDSEDYIDVAENCKIEFNQKNATAGNSYNFVGAFARTVILDDEIIALEAFELTEGGLITNIGDSDISYIKGEMSNVLLKNLDSYKNFIVYLNGEKSELWALTKGTVFDYYVSEDEKTLIIVASKRAITDTLETINQTGLSVGKDIYPLSKEHTVYYSKDGSGYSSSVDMIDILGRIVTLYIDYAGYIRYVTPAFDDSVNDELYAVILGYSKEGLQNPEVMLYTIEKSGVNKKTYTISERASKDNATVIDEIKNAITTINSASSETKNDTLKNVNLLYKIRVNDKNEITSIKKATHFESPTIKETGFTVGTLSNNAEAYVSSPRIYFPEAVICALYYSEKTGMMVKSLTWSDLRQKTTAGVLFNPYGKSGSSDVELMLLRGDVEKINKSDSYMTYGLCTDITTGYDSVEDEEVLNVRIEGVDYIVSKYRNMFDGIKNAAFVIYNPESAFLSQNEIMPHEVFDLSLSPDEWEISEIQRDDTGFVTVSSSTSGIYRDNLTKVDSKRVYFTSGDIWYMGEDVPVYEVIESKDSNRFITRDRQEIPAGSNVWYVYDNYEIRAMFYMS